MNQPLKIIGLHGPAGCGKDTIAEFLCDTQQFRRVSLAEPIRQGIVAMFRIPENYLTDRDLKEQPLDELCGKSPRQVMQTLGTEWGRDQVSRDIWLSVADRKIDYIIRMAAAGNAYIEGIVISDIRFHDEAEWLRNQGGTIWHIQRPDNKDSTDSIHVSEIPLSQVNGEPLILNDGDIDHLAEKINLILHPTIKEDTENA